MSLLFGAGIVAFVVALVISIVLHEAGHFLAAKKFKMKATQFFVGFGPRIWSFRRGETEYGIKWLLLGGYVKIVGMTPLEDVAPSDEPRAFYRQKAYKRAIVLAAGSAIHFVVAFVVLLGMAMGLGLRGEETVTTEVMRVSACVPAPGTQTCPAGAPASPALVAGFKPGDKVVGLAGKPVSSWSQLQQILQAQPPGPVDVVIERDGVRQTRRVALVAATDRPGSFLGITPNVIAGPVRRLGPVEATKFAATSMGAVLVAVADVLVDLPSAVPKLFSAERASSTGGQASSVYGVARVSGELFASADMTGRDKTVLFLGIVASVNVFVGVLNLIPLLPLDGGHLAVLSYERLRAWLARRRGRPDPGPVDYAKLMPATVAVLVLLISLGALLIAADIVNPLKVIQ